MAKVMATERGHDNICVREPGDVFDWSGPLGPWMKLVDEESSIEEMKIPMLKDKKAKKQANEDVI